MLGFAVSKGIGVKVVSEMKPKNRARGLLIFTGPSVFLLPSLFVISLFLIISRKKIEENEVKTEIDKETAL